MAPPQSSKTRSSPSKSKLSKTRSSPSKSKQASPAQKTIKETTAFLVPGESQRRKITNRRSKRQRKPSMKAMVEVEKLLNDQAAKMLQTQNNGQSSSTSLSRDVLEPPRCADQPDVGVNQVSDDAPNEELDNPIKKYTKRGPTQLKRQKRRKGIPEIEFNSKGQPVGEYSDEMASELVSVAWLK